MQDQSNGQERLIERISSDRTGILPAHVPVHYTSVNYFLPFIYYSELNKPEYNLTNSDIARSQPMCHKFKTSRPPSNPLNPIYKLAHVEIKAPVPLKFIRDQISNDDIDGAKPTIKKYFETRDVLAVKDIAGAKAKDPYVRRPETGYSSYNYDDVNKNQFKSARCINPLAP